MSTVVQASHLDMSFDSTKPRVPTMLWSFVDEVGNSWQDDGQLTPPKVEAGVKLIFYAFDRGYTGGDSYPIVTKFTVWAYQKHEVPTLTPGGGTASFTEDGSAVAVDPGLTVTDVGSAHIQSATVQITTGYQNGQDVLAFVNTATITGSFDAATGTLTLTGTDTLANYQAALRSVTYNNTSQSPNTATRSVSFKIPASPFSEWGGATSMEYEPGSGFLSSPSTTGTSTSTILQLPPGGVSFWSLGPFTVATVPGRYYLCAAVVVTYPNGTPPVTFSVDPEMEVTQGGN